MPAQAQLAWAELLDSSAESGDLAAIYPRSFPQATSVAVNELGLVSGESPLAGALLEWGSSNALVEGLAGHLHRGLGVPETVSQEALTALQRGCAVLIIQCPSGRLSEYQISEIVHQHHGKGFGRSGHYGKPAAPRAN